MIRAVLEEQNRKIEKLMKRLEGDLMELGKATAIFKNIFMSERTKEEKMFAIKTVVDMETHNGFTKQEILNALDWLINEHQQH